MVPDRVCSEIDSNGNVITVCDGSNNDDIHGNSEDLDIGSKSDGSNNDDSHGDIEYDEIEDFEFGLTCWFVPPICGILGPHRILPRV